MKLPRRNFLYLAAGAAALPAVSRFAWAQAYPTRPVRIVVGFAAGGAGDIAARLMGQWLSERLGRNSSWRIGQVATAISPPRRVCTRPQTAMHYSWCLRRTRPTRRVESMLASLVIEAGQSLRTGWPSGRALTGKLFRSSPNQSTGLLDRLRPI
jgi:hypothetical protein